MSEQVNSGASDICEGPRDAWDLIDARWGRASTVAKQAIAAPILVTAKPAKKRRGTAKQAPLTSARRHAGETSSFARK